MIINAQRYLLYFFLVISRYFIYDSIWACRESN